MRFLQATGAVLLPLLTLASTATAIDFDPESEDSIRAVSRQYAYGLMAQYGGNASGINPQEIGIWPKPHYWWEGGAAWGGMIEYTMLTGDQSHVKTLQQALTANYGSAHDFILDYMRAQTGNDDQAFWALAVMSALEYQFPDPDKAPAAYLDVAINSFKNIVGRWDESTCGGGLKWQIYPENAYGYNYKNSISNGAAFALGARLARYTGNQEYADWAVKIYDWTKKVGLITDLFEVFDGSDDKTNCASVADKTQWTYNNAMFLHGSAFMFDFTNGDNIWKERTSGFLKHAEVLFFKPYDNATNIMYEWACETGETGRRCNLDQQSFKAYLARFMAKTAVMAPFTKDTITKYLKASAVGAAKSCSGGNDGVTCGSKWYTGAWDGTSGVGQQLSALEVTQALLMIQKNVMPVKKGESKPESSTTANPKPTSTPASTTAPAPSSRPPAPAPSSQAPTPVPSNEAPSTPSSSAAHEPAPVSSAPTSSVTPAPVKPTVVTNSSTVVLELFSSPVNLGGEFDEKTASTSPTPSVTETVDVPPVSQTSAPPVPAVPTLSASDIATSCTKSDTSCSCTPSVTETVYVPPVSQTSAPPVPAVPTLTASGIATSLIPGSSANSSVPRPRLLVPQSSALLSLPWSLG
ncbi:glycosyl hydrolase family 76-domain-containing protein [Ampelomyces quisqualis]|uniref:mannan endo-1,6-alpha-mannosidase n=1 Tax=Ampelomyces quisqualis TaxID=50730 RepID=A0A6A5Q8X7_AMPQU|nr:glycosyl hydrolase family 76-domain-containing protein [Ampelomyces quisqualis]